MILCHELCSLIAGNFLNRAVIFADDDLASNCPFVVSVGNDRHLLAFFCFADNDDVNLLVDSRFKKALSIAMADLDRFHQLVRKLKGYLGLALF